MARPNQEQLNETNGLQAEPEPKSLSKDAPLMSEDHGQNSLPCPESFLGNRSKLAPTDPQKSSFFRADTRSKFWSAE